MNQTYKLKFQQIQIKAIPGDTLVEMTAYLVDSANIPFADAAGSIDTFAVTVKVASMPSSGFGQYLRNIINNFLRDKHSTTVTATLQQGSKIAKDISDTSALVAGQSISSSAIPAETLLDSVRDNTSIRLGSAATATGSFGLVTGIKGWTIDFSEVTTLTNLVDFSML